MIISRTCKIALKFTLGQTKHWFDDVLISKTKVVSEQTYIVYKNLLNEILDVTNQCQQSWPVKTTFNQFVRSQSTAHACAPTTKIQPQKKALIIFAHSQREDHVYLCEMLDIFCVFICWRSTCRLNFTI